MVDEILNHCVIVSLVTLMTLKFSAAVLYWVSCVAVLAGLLGAVTCDKSLKCDELFRSSGAPSVRRNGAGQKKV